MDVKELNKSQLILLALLLSFVTSIATGITTVTLMEKAPQSVTIPINRIVRETVEKVVPQEVEVEALTDEQKKLLEELKAIKPLSVSLYKKGDKEDTLLGTGMLLGENKVVIASKINPPKEDEVFLVKSVLGEKKVSKVSIQDDLTIVELEKTTTETPKEEPAKDSETGTQTEVTPQTL